MEPGDISHIHTEAVGSSVTAVAGENTTITIKAHDEFGNLKSKGGEMDKISVETVGYGSSHWSHEIEDMEDGTYQINVTAIKSGVYPIYMKVNGEDIKNAPFSVNVEAGRVDTTKSTVLGAEGVLDTWKVDDNVVLVRLKDEYDNKVVDKAQINNTVVEVGHGLAIVENEYVVERAKGFGESGDLEFLFKVPAYRLRVTAEKVSRGGGGSEERSDELVIRLVVATIIAVNSQTNTLSLSLFTLIAGRNSRLAQGQVLRGRGGERRGELGMR